MFLTIGTLLVLVDMLRLVIFPLFPLLTLFDCFWPLVYQSSHVYQDCINSVPIVKNRQKQSKDNQNSKNDHRCINRHMSTKTVPTVYQHCTNRQKQSKDSETSKKWPLVYQSSQVYQDCANSVPIVKNSKTAKMTIGVPIVTCLHRVRRIHKVRVRLNIHFDRVRLGSFS